LRLERAFAFIIVFESSRSCIIFIIMAGENGQEEDEEKKAEPSSTCKKRGRDGGDSASDIMVSVSNSNSMPIQKKKKPTSSKDCAKCNSVAEALLLADPEPPRHVHQKGQHAKFWPGRFEGMHVIVTGASSGIGRATALRFALEGASVGLHYGKNKAGAEETRSIIHSELKSHGMGKSMLPKLIVYGCDMQHTDQIDAMFENFLRDFDQRLDILVNNSGMQLFDPFHEIKMDDWNYVVNVNLRGYFRCMQHAIRHFLSRDYAGVIVNDTSVHQMVPKPFYPAYAACKGMVCRYLLWIHLGVL